jgi:hypothetical protein
MTDLLRKAFAEASKLDERDQDGLARFMLAELESDSEWDRAFAESQDVLAALAAEARRDHAAGRTTPLDPDAL